MSYTWDDNGNLTARGSDSFSWDFEDRMTSATVNSVTTDFTYRGDGLRETRSVGMATTRFTWDLAAGLPVVLDDGNQYVYGAGLVSMKQSGDWHYYLADGLGSTMKVVDDTGTVEDRGRERGRRGRARFGQRCVGLTLSGHGLPTPP